MFRLLIIWTLVMAGAARADTVVASGVIRAKSVITLDDISLVSETYPGGIQDVQTVLGMEARVNIYAGRPIYLKDIGPQALVERNALVILRYRTPFLTITAEGRALDRAGIGEVVQVMNLASRLTVTGVVAADGSIEVFP